MFYVSPEEGGRDETWGVMGELELDDGTNHLDLIGRIQICTKEQGIDKVYNFFAGSSRTSPCLFLRLLKLRLESSVQLKERQLCLEKLISPQRKPCKLENLSSA